MKLTARNVMCATVERMVHDAVVSEVELRLDCGLKVVAVITRWSAERLGLAAGSKAYAVIPAEDIAIGIELGGADE